MASLTDYFAKKAYQPKYFIGDRVFGKYDKIPFIGTVGNDTVISEIDGPRISIHLDLPIKVDGVVKGLLFVTHKDIKPLKDYNE
jgi:hypothetical protein